MRARAIVPVALAALAALGCGERMAAQPPQAPAATLGELHIHAPRARLTGAAGAVYLRVENGGRTDDRLLGVETAAAAVAETHETVEQDGVMRMSAHPDGFAVPAGGTLELRPGGKHVMLIEPRPASGSASIPITLVFERAGRLALAVPIVEE